ncbi:putative fungistatic metabolite [Rhypophila decipiens]
MRSTQAKTLASFFLFSSLSTTLAQLTPPANLPGAWTYQGCYTDVAGRTIGAAGYADAVGMTNQACIAFCSSKGFQYAGTEYSQECFCGESLAPAATVAAGDCTMACSGNATQPCGGPSRLSLFYSSAPVGPQPNPGVNGFTYMGCYSEGTTGRTLTHPITTITNAEMTVGLCTAACHTAGYILAGVEYGGECFCGNTIANGGARATSGCNMLCNGNQTEFCGGGSRLNIYNYLNQFSATSSSVSSTRSSTSTAVAGTTTTTAGTGVTTSTGGTAATTSTASTSTLVATGPAQPPTVGNFNFYGCRTEGTGIRALSGATFASDTMTLESCRAFCAAYTYFGVEYSRECYCGNSFNAGSLPAAAGDCSMTCMGNALEFCGAGNRLSVYAKSGTPPPSSSSSSTGTSRSSTVTGGTATTSTPAATGLPAGWASYGCYIDGRQGRILNYQAPDSQLNTPGRCANICKDLGYTISGTEYSVQCFCGNSIVNGGSPATNQAECGNNCAGDPTQKCGGGDRMSIVSQGAPQVLLPPAPQTGGLNGSWTYAGCVRDNVNDKRTFFWQSLFPGTMTPNKCLTRCAEYGYMAAGIEYGEECYCGDPANVVDTTYYRPESECNIVCPGNSSSICGGGSRLTTYFWTGTPFYSWTFPQDWRAGQYQFLIGGLNIPLMTMESITGKVQFISKGGTGPGNETGVYELDVSLAQSNPAQAWRTLHLKTDVFCAAGITLPDKVGRQLTVGGWSGDSTYGTRLLWPDGSAGVKGVRDWQENVAELHLQKGRWYPSVMIMTNGSILVVGGEEGSNAAAVPSIEILPATGTEPIRMEWLARTDPNNLYPFLAVLPSGGIFVAYYNEARILNAATFDTIKTLPNIPGAVNNPLAGRTYPLEGTAVLLPQRYPYNENPLGVLICGGSSNGGGYALDNCVSTYPDAATPEWKIERMPSFRVMPCMAPLPDGTYLIANGAKHGVAGFGLANQPNLNALLYDPTKPLGSRITVMANTTIARMYHSEAITLLDGRVLISGSNPEDTVNPEEYRVEVFVPPYLLAPGKARPTFTLLEKDWTYGSTHTFTLGQPAQNGGPITVTLLGAVSSTHGNSMGARTIMPQMSCAGTSCTVTAPPTANIAPPGWYQFFVLDAGIPAVGVYVRIGGDPAQLGNWPNFPDFSRPGM